MRKTDNSIEPVTGESGSRERKNRVPEFEGLRGILASWVILGHILLFSGFTYTAGLTGILFSPVLGVYVFMMLSGFVVTSALDSGSGNWSDFMRRRIFRIYPVYLICLALSIAMLPVSQNLATRQCGLEIGQSNSIRLHEVSDNFGLYVVADLLLLQNLLPREQFPHAHETFLPPTWSLSLEWMFYLAMPLLFGLWCKRRSVRLAGFLLLIALTLLSHTAITRICPSLNLATASYFLTGIVSYGLWKRLPSTLSGALPALAFWTCIGAGIVCLPFSFKLWFAVMAVVLYDRFHRRNLWPLEAVRCILKSPPITFLGRISYSSYLFHWIAIEVCLFLLAAYFPQLQGRTAVAIFCCLTACPLTFAASWLLFKYVEVPMIALGSKKKSGAGSRRISPAPPLPATSGH